MAEMMHETSDKRAGIGLGDPALRERYRGHPVGDDCWVRCRAITACGSRQNAVSEVTRSGAACSSGPMWPEPGRMARAPLRRWAAAVWAAATVHIASSALVASNVGVSK